MNQTFIEELIEKFKLPWKHSAFNYYFFWIVLVFGSLGIIITSVIEINSQVPHYYNISQCIGTTFIALIAGSLVDLNLSLSFKNIPSLIINSIAFIGISVFLLYLSFNIKSNWSFVPSVSGYLLALLIWILANSDNERLSDGNYYKKMMEKSGQLTKNWSNE